MRIISCDYVKREASLAHQIFMLFLLKESVINYNKLKKILPILNFIKAQNE